VPSHSSSSSSSRISSSISSNSKEEEEVEEVDDLPLDISNDTLKLSFYGQYKPIHVKHRKITHLITK